MEPRRILIGGCIALAALATGAWVISQILGVQGQGVTKVWESGPKHGPLVVELTEGKLQIAQYATPKGATTSEPCQAEFTIPYMGNLRIANGNWSPSPYPNVWLMRYTVWGIQLSLTGIFAIASIYPAIVVRRYRLLMLAVGLAAAAYATYRVGVVFYRAHDSFIPWERDFTDAFTDLLVIAVLTAALFAWNGISKRPNRDPLCKACGYNLTGNLSGICPECGRTVTL